MGKQDNNFITINRKIYDKKEHLKQIKQLQNEIDWEFYQIIQKYNFQKIGNDYVNKKYNITIKLKIKHT